MARADTGNLVETVQQGYAFTGPALDLGALVVDGTTHRDAQVRIPLAMLNRHGLVAGATGTGKTKTLQLMAEQLSSYGVPVFAADIKGDLSGIATPGQTSDKVATRAADVGQDWQPASCPVEYYALGGLGNGIPIRATITSFGPVLLSKVLGLNEVQESSLGLVFHFADKHGLPLLDLKDLRATIQYLTSDDGAAELEGLGGLSKSTAGVILRELIAFSDRGADAFFGEPEFDTAELLRTTPDGRGVVSLLELPDVQDRPELFSTFLMWLLADLFDDLPEVGDVEQPKLVFFFDEAHLLFKDASKDFLAAITQTVRLIRSKGVGVFFVTQTPKDVPNDVLAQLGNRIQHALRAHTPDDAKALKATVSTFPMSPYDLAEVLTGMGIGEAVVTVLSEKGAPTPVAWTRLRAPQSLMAPTDPAVIRDGEGVGTAGEVRGAGRPGLGVRAAGAAARGALGGWAAGAAARPDVTASDSAARADAATPDSAAATRARAVHSREGPRVAGVPVLHALGGDRPRPGDHPQPVRDGKAAQAPMTCPLSVIRRTKPQVTRLRVPDNGQLAALVLVLILSPVLALTACGAEPSAAPRPTPPPAPAPTPSTTVFAQPRESPAPPTLPRGGRTLFPRYRLVGYVGAPASPALGRLGVGDLEARAREIERRLKPYAKERELMPVLELIATLVHPRPGRDGKYRQRTTDEVIERYLAAARRVDGLLLLNIQPGRADFLPEVKAYERWLREPDVGLALDPEWAVGPGQVPGRVFGRTSGRELDQVARYLAGIVQRYDLPEKVLVFHQLHASIVKDQSALRPHRGVVLIKSVDGIGHRADKEATWRKLTRGLPRHIHAGFKLFFTEDRRHGALMTPQQVLALRPTPVYVMYE